MRTEVLRALEHLFVHKFVKVRSGKGPTFGTSDQTSTERDLFFQDREESTVNTRSLESLVPLCEAM